MKEENIQLGIKRDALLESNHKQLEKIEKFKKKKNIEETKEEAVKKVVELKKQTENLEVENKKLMELKETQPDPEGLSKLIKEKTEMSTKIEALIERVNKSESDYKRVQEKLDKYINCKWRKYKGTKLIVP